MSHTAPALGGDGYAALLDELKERIRTARLRAAVTVNQELILLYWSIGDDILARQSAEGWGTRVIERLAQDLRRDFPDMTGLSSRNLKYMRAFAEAYRDREIVQQLVARLPWGHNIKLVEAIKDNDDRLWYARQAIEHGWSRNVLAHQIDTGLLQRQGKALTNFARTLPRPNRTLLKSWSKTPTASTFLRSAPRYLNGSSKRG
jgi:predicted nuclease of restriction endonuclease-like (RecB) superfamily